jgi:hypothetical protein
MADQTMRDELNDVKQHAKDAMRASLLAARTAIDFALSKLDGEPEPPKSGEAGRSPASDPAAEAPPPAIDDTV